AVFKRRRATEGECERFAVSHFLGPRTAKAFRRGGNAPLRVGFAVSAGKRRARLVAAAFRCARLAGKVHRATNGARQKHYANADRQNRSAREDDARRTDSAVRAGFEAFRTGGRGFFSATAGCRAAKTDRGAPERSK